jgi:hypothetical protein
MPGHDEKTNPLKVVWRVLKMLAALCSPTLGMTGMVLSPPLASLAGVKSLSSRPWTIARAA